MIEGLEVVARWTVFDRGVELTELDVDAVLAARRRWRWSTSSPTPTPGCAARQALAGRRRPARGRDDRADHGEHRAPRVANDVIERITGVRSRRPSRTRWCATPSSSSWSTTPRRCAAGWPTATCTPERVDAAMANYFQPRNLTALREMALLWLADQVEVALQRYRTDQQMTDIWETRERVVVALTGGPESETVLRRAARIAERTESSESVRRARAARRRPRRRPGRGGRRAAPPRRERRRLLPHRRRRPRPDGLAGVRRGVDATQLVIGTSRRSRLARVLVESIGTRVVQDSGHIDVHMVTPPEAGRGCTCPAGSAQSGHAPSHRMGAERAAAAHRRRDRDPRQGLLGSPPTSCCSSSPP